MTFCSTSQYSNKTKDADAPKKKLSGLQEHLLSTANKEQFFGPSLPRQALFKAIGDAQKSTELILGIGMFIHHKARTRNADDLGKIEDVSCRNAPSAKLVSQPPFGSFHHALPSPPPSLESLKPNMYHLRSAQPLPQQLHHPLKMLRFLEPRVRFQTWPPNEHGKHLAHSRHAIRSQALMPRRLHAPSTRQPPRGFIRDTSSCSLKGGEMGVVGGSRERGGKIGSKALCHGLREGIRNIGGIRRTQLDV